MTVTRVSPRVRIASTVLSLRAATGCSSKGHGDTRAEDLVLLFVLSDRRSRKEAHMRAALLVAFSLLLVLFSFPRPAAACPAGYTRSGNRCVRYSCPAGYTRDGNRCVKYSCRPGCYYVGGGKCRCSRR
jgi:hypothetical protein